MELIRDPIRPAPSALLSNPAATNAAAAVRSAAPTEAPAALAVRWIRHQDELQAAQRLRWNVFMQEMGAYAAHHAQAGLDADAFDEACEHLVVAPVDDPMRVVGTYRVLLPEAAQRLGRLYSDGEFDLRPLDGLRSQAIELGRSCVAPEHRQGSVIMMLWRELVALMIRRRIDIGLGCASVPMRDGGHHAWALWERLQQTALADASLRVTPWKGLPPRPAGAAQGPHPADHPGAIELPVEPPPLIKGYLRCGAKVLGPPAWDESFGCADLPMMLRLSELSQGYLKRFASAAA